MDFINLDDPAIKIILTCSVYAIIVFFVSRKVLRDMRNEIASISIPTNQLSKMALILSMVSTFTLGALMLIAFAFKFYLTV